jgi:hypothetical protein
MRFVPTHCLLDLQKGCNEYRDSSNFSKRLNDHEVGSTTSESRPDLSESYILIDWLKQPHVVAYHSNLNIR